MAQRVVAVEPGVDPNGRPALVVTYEAYDALVTRYIRPREAPSAKRFLAAFQAGKPLSSRDAIAVQRAAEWEGQLYKHRGGPKDWTPRF